MNDDGPEYRCVGNALLFIFAIAAIAAALTGWKLSDGVDAEITAKLEAEARERKAIIGPQACIIQFEAGARWMTSSQTLSPECATAARLVPDHVLSHPLQSK